MLKLLFLVAFVASASAMRFDKGFFMDTISMSEDRIIGGLEGENDQFPYQVLLFTGNHYFCGGSIIAKRFILTAAQCTQGNLSSPSNVIAIVGYPKNEKHYELSKIKNHPKYKPGKLANDISVLRTKKSIVFDDFVQRIALPTADVSEGNVSATVSGYGQYRHGHGNVPDNFPSKLQWTDTITLNRTDCIHRLGSKFSKKVHENTICTLNPPEVGICLGDAGSPLATRGSPRVLIGVASWSTRRCARGLPDVYVRVFPHLKFIRRALKK